jgi:hypothetical protein
MKSIFELAGTIECKSGHHVEFGKTTETIRDEDELLGTEKVSISAGLPAAEKVVLSTTAKALVFGGAAIGALLAAAGGDIASAAFPDEASGVDAMKQMGLSSAPIIVGTGLQVAALAYLVKKLNTALTNAISSINLDDEGIRIAVTDTNAHGATNNGIQMSVGPPAALGVPQPPHLTFKMSPGAGAAECITLKKAPNGGNITINQDGTVIDDHTGATVNTSINLAAASIIMERNGGGKITVDNAGVTLERGGAHGKIAVADNVTTVGDVNNVYLKVSSTGIDVKIDNSNNGFQAGSLKVGANNMIQLG